MKYQHLHYCNIEKLEMGEIFDLLPTIRSSVDMFFSLHGTKIRVDFPFFRRRKNTILLEGFFFGIAEDRMSPR